MFPDLHFQYIFSEAPCIHLCTPTLFHKSECTCEYTLHAYAWRNTQYTPIDMHAHRLHLLYFEFVYPHQLFLFSVEIGILEFPCIYEFNLGERRIVGVSSHWSVR